ncbi:hypothetical protein BGX34_011864 [Mortierella sp. NVP85]|nr:hypothetical protein BGX34_011864 [Mortierella sp. NVP85]
MEEDPNERDINELSERTSILTIATAVAPEDANGSTTATVVAPEKMASGVPNVPVKTGGNAFTPAQARGPSDASLALNKKQAAEHAAAAIKAYAVEIPETDSIGSRIKIFGGVAGGRPTGQRKLGVRDMVRKFTDAGDQNLDEIAHVSRGHHNAEPGFCSVYSLPTTAQPLRSVARRRMSHELDEDETREIVKVLGGMARSEHPQQQHQQHSQQ